MKIRHFLLISTVLLNACNESERSEIYNENNTSVVNGVVYNISEKPINGLYRTYYPNGNLRMEIHSQNGLPNGIGRFYDNDGVLLYQGMFANGKLNGSLYQYYQDGTLHNEMNYKDGELDGLQKVFTQDGEQTAEIEYKNGKPINGYVILKHQKVELTPDELKAFTASSQPAEEN